VISIYDKADTGSIRDRELKDLIKDFHKNNQQNG